VKKLVPAAALALVSLVPALALACPAASAGNCCGGAFMEYANSFGGGLLVGVLSVVAEAAWRRRRGGSA
jgi:hypothetical protein